MVKSNTDIFQVLGKKGAVAGYKEKFQRALVVFHHQTVIDPTTLKTVPLSKWDIDPPQELQQYCGKYPFNNDL